MKKRRKPERNKATQITRVTPYELATLAARICPARCIDGPEEAIRAAQKLITAGKSMIMVAEAMERLEKEEEAEREEALSEKNVDWSRGIKEITGEGRRDCGMKRFKQFLECYYPGEAQEQLNTYKRDGFTLLETMILEQDFRDWRKQPKRKKGKQGQVKNREKDVRTKPKLTPLPRQVRERLGRSDNESE
jgi:hypothetical protein